MSQNKIIGESPLLQIPVDGTDYWKKDKMGDKLKGLTVQNSLGEVVPFESLFADKRTLIIFSRHFNCYVCKEQMKSLAKLPWEALASSNFDVKVVGCGRARAIASFASETGFPVEKCFVDTPTNIYAALKLTRAENFSQLRSKQPSNKSCCSVFSGFMWTCFSYCRRGNQGNVYQLGGAFLFGPGQQCNYKFIDESAEEHIQFPEVLRILQLNEDRSQ